MSDWDELLKKGISALKWPYPIRYGVENEVSTDVLILGGGIAGCWAAISAARDGLRVVLVEKGATVRSGAASSGTDHWQGAVDNPCCPLTAEEFIKVIIDAHGGYISGISRYIQYKDSYETLLELEQMGAKVRDTEDEFKGAEFRDEDTKLLFAYDYSNKVSIRVWGSTFKPALYNECKKLGVKIYDRVMVTRLLTEGGKPGSRVVGATGLNVRTGEFYIFKAKATVLCMSRPQRNWLFSSELQGIYRPPQIVGNGYAMAWRVGAEFTMMEKSQPATSHGFPFYGTGSSTGAWFACSIVDANGKEIPWVDREGRILSSMSQRHYPCPGQKFFLYRAPFPPGYEPPRLIPDLAKRIQKGEFVLPLYADLPSMPDMERKVIFGMMVGEEVKTKIPIVQTYTQAGFNPEKDLLQGYQFLLGDPFSPPTPLPYERTFGQVSNAGGLLHDWDLKSNLDGLYGAGDLLFGGNDTSHASTTGRWAGAKAAEYALTANESVITRKQVDDEKARVYMPIEREDGIDWREFNLAINRVMQCYCGEPKSEELMKIGLISLKELEENDAPLLQARNPHELMHVIDVEDIRTCSEMILHACRARKASSKHLFFMRSDYPEVDPPEWQKFITIKLEDGNIRVGELPADFWLPFEENYERHRPRRPR